MADASESIASYKMVKGDGTINSPYSPDMKELVLSMQSYEDHLKIGIDAADEKR